MAVGTRNLEYGVLGASGKGSISSTLDFLGAIHSGSGPRVIGSLNPKQGNMQEPPELPNPGVQPEEYNPAPLLGGPGYL